MRHAILLLSLLAAAACNGVTTLPSPRAPLPAEPGGGGGTPAASALEAEIHALVNRRRADRRLPPLQWDDRIAAEARAHSQAMASGGRPFGHDGFETRAARLGELMTVRSMAENVAYDSREGTQLGEQVVQGWIASAGHRQNIDGSFTRTGIGVARRADGTRYFTQIFINDG